MNMILKDEYIAYTVPRQKNIALIAHDGKKEELIRWCEKNKDVLARHFLSGTGTTARLVAERTGLPVKAYNSGPLGGDQQIGAKIVEGKIDIVIFFSDPLAAQPHDPDVKALLRIAQVYDVPMANNKASADYFIHSALLGEEYDRHVTNFQRSVDQRVAERMEQTAPVPDGHMPAPAESACL